MHTRRLAAIMFTDIVGYTAIMQSDEAKALEIRSRHREVFEEFHQKHNGTILQYYGDGTLSIFDSAIEAATCAIAMQLAFQQEPKVPLRIGIHTGDILFSKEEALGDGVNVASRIESMAVQGSVMVSDTVKEYLKNQSDIPLKSMGSYQFKNVERKMEVFAIDREGLNIPDPNELTGKFAPKTETKKPLLRRIPVWGQYLGGFLIFLILAPFLYFPIFNLINGNARETTNITNENGEKIKREIINFKDKKRFWVTSFDNLDGNEENNWLQIGFPYALEMDWDQDPYVHNVYSEHNLGQNLRDHIKGAENADCEYILQGAYSHDSLYHVIIKILDAKTGKKEFELSFDEKELFPLMDHISLQVKKTLGVPEDHLAGTIDLPVAQFLTESEEAYKVFIGGMYGKGNYSTLALEAYTKATEIDPTFAWASYMVSMFHHRFQRSDRKAKIFIDQAMAHRSRLPDIFEIDVRILNYKVKGEDEKALELTEALTQLNPGNTIYLNDLTNEYFDQDEYEKLLETIKKQRKVTGKTTLHQEREIIAFLRIGEVNKAKKIAEKMVEESPEDIKALYRLGIVQLADEEWEEARRIFEKINLFAPEEKHIDKVFEHISFMEDSADLVDFPDLYQKFVGRYWVEEFANFQIDMIDINGFLFAYPTSQSKMAMYALSPYKYSTFQGFDIEFIPDEEGNVVKARMYEDKNPPFYALRIEPEVEAIFDAFKAEKFEEIESRLETFADRYPYIPTLKKMKTHIEFQAAPEYSPDAYKDLVGKYEMGKLSCEISLKEGKPYFELFGLPVFQDAFRMYEIAPEVFMNLAALNGEIKIQREKGKVSGIELTLSGKSGGLKMERTM